MQQSSKKYYQIHWTHNFEDEPFLYFIETDCKGFETKKIEKFKTGKIYFASQEYEKGTFLCPHLFDISEYNYKSSIEEISALEISAETFYKEWNETIKILQLNK